MRPAGVPGATSEGTASFILATKIWPSNATNIQPSEAIKRTSHWYSVIPAYQAWSSAAVAVGIESGMRQLHLFKVMLLAQREVRRDCADWRATPTPCACRETCGGRASSRNYPGTRRPRAARAH